jgi:hypothetical protein
MRALFTMVAITAMAMPVLAHAGAMADVEVYDRTSGVTLPVFRHKGRLYVAGEPRHQYEVRIANRTSGRVLAVTSVDGVNVISGKTAAQSQGGYVLNGWDNVSVDGWRKSLDEVATFYFTSLPDSYASRTGRPDNVGVIGVALFSERTYCCARRDEEARDKAAEPSARAAPAPEAQANSMAGGSESRRDRSESKLGTGHGHREASPVQNVEFERASNTPEETIVIYYDSRRNLVAQGVITQDRRYAQERPKPFPEGQFVPDP